MLNKIKIKDKILPFDKSIRVSGDKSISIRCVLLASQAIGKSRIYNLLESEDVINSLRVIKKLGINYIKKKNFYEINGYGLASYIQSMQATKPLPAKQTVNESGAGKDASPTRSVQISISQEAMSRRSNSE